jgi:hypothetical protein
MSRSSYSDDWGDEFPGQMELFRANVERSIKGKAGQARLRELRDALVALPVKELHPSIFADGTAEAPKVCGLGAWALAKAGGNPDAAHAMVPGDADDYETAVALKSHGWPKLVVLEAVYENDESWRSMRETPAERYHRILAWVNENLTAGRSQE